MRPDAVGHRHRALLLSLALAVPLLVCWVFSGVRDSVTATTVALVLVLVVVACAATGDRTAGVLAALSSGAWFDVFMTEPYGRLEIHDPDDLEATVLLLLVGVGVSELAAWGARQQARLARRAGYLDGVLGVADIVAAPNASPDELVRHCCDQLVQILGIDGCRYVAATTRGQAPPTARLEHDGTVTLRGHPVDVERDGLPLHDEIGLDVRDAGTLVGQFRLASSTRAAHPTIEQRRVAVLLADQVAASVNPGAA
jgi:K+-sensing histidine kinase KdpD